MRHSEQNERNLKFRQTGKLRLTVVLCDPFLYCRLPRKDTVMTVLSKPSSERVSPGPRDSTLWKFGRVRGVLQFAFIHVLIGEIQTP